MHQRSSGCTQDRLAHCVPCELRRGMRCGRSPPCRGSRSPCVDCHRFLSRPSKPQLRHIHSRAVRSRTLHTSIPRATYRPCGPSWRKRPHQACSCCRPRCAVSRLSSFHLHAQHRGHRLLVEQPRPLPSSYHHFSGKIHTAYMGACVGMNTYVHKNSDRHTLPTAVRRASCSATSAALRFCARVHMCMCMCACGRVCACVSALLRAGIRGVRGAGGVRGVHVCACVCACMCALHSSTSRLSSAACEYSSAATASLFCASSCASLARQLLISFAMSSALRTAGSALGTAGASSSLHRPI